MNTSRKKTYQWVINVMSIVVAVLFGIYEDVITALPFFNEIASVLVILALAVFIRHWLLSRIKLKSGEIYQVKSQKDGLDKVISALFGIGFVIYAVFHFVDVGESSLFSIALFILGMIFIANSFSNGSVNLRLMEENKINLDDEYELNPADKKIEFSDFQMKTYTQTDKVNKLGDLLLNKTDAIQIKRWMETHLKNPAMEYYWVNTDEKVRL